MAIRDYDIISFYTKDTPYEIEANEFKKNLKEFGFSTKLISLTEGNNVALHDLSAIFG